MPRGSKTVSHTIRFKPETMDAIRKGADASGMSINDYVQNLVAIHAPQRLGVVPVDTAAPSRARTRKVAGA